MPSTVIIEKNIFAKKGGISGLVQSMTEVLVSITAEAKSLTPVDFGELANSIMWKLDGNTEDFNNGKISGSGGVTPKGNTRNGTGDLQAPDQDKLTVKDQGRTSSGDSKYIGYVGTNSDHWYPEFGTRKMIAQPFLRPAKAVVADGGKAANIAKRFCRAAMEKEFEKRKKEIERLKNG